MARPAAVPAPPVPPVVQRVRTPGLETISFSWLSGAVTAKGHDPYLDRLALYPPDVSGSAPDVAFRLILEAFREMGRSIQIMAENLAMIWSIPAGGEPSTVE